ncbi:hypothetical protein HDU87_007765 [Geranomyces variabilis]|uniref:Apple domain-containing protein n=1 Tax=Geranomyces variabilis TaxID=109894 RepID=A0AAD5XK60_9FUNG|nr:hypothetical protein HDU87_007765 [Geranomyces variabilis]
MRNSVLAVLGILGTACVGVLASDYDQCYGGNKTSWALLPGDFPVAKLNLTGKPDDGTAPAANECQCAQACQQADACAFFTWNDKAQSCAIRRLTHVDGVTTTFMAGVNSPLYVDLAVPWFGKTLPLDFDVAGANPIVNVTDQDTCISACQTRGPDVCNAVTYRRATHDCWLKKLDAVPQTSIGVRTGIPITQSQDVQKASGGGSGNGLKIGLGVGIGALAGVLGAFGVYFCCIRGKEKKHRRAEDLSQNDGFNRTSTAFSGTPSSEASFMNNQSKSPNRWSNMSDASKPAAAAAAASAAGFDTYQQYMEHLRPVQPRPGSMLPPSGRPLSTHYSSESGMSGYQNSSYLAVPQALSSKAFEAESSDAGSHHPTLPPPQYITLPYGAAAGSTTAGSVASDVATAGQGTIAGAKTESVATPSSTVSTAPSLPTSAAGGGGGTASPGGAPWVDSTGTPLEKDEFFMDRVHLVKRMYSPKAPDEILVRLGDSVVLQKLWGDGWATGVNTTTGKQGVMPLAALGLQRDGSQAPASLQAKTGELPETEMRERSLDRRR